MNIQKIEARIEELTSRWMAGDSEGVLKELQINTLSVEFPMTKASVMRGIAEVLMPESEDWDVSEVVGGAFLITLGPTHSDYREDS